MSSRQRRHLLVGLLGMLAGLFVAGSLVVVAGWRDGSVDGLAGPLLAVLVALLVHRFGPRRTPGPDADS